MKRFQRSYRICLFLLAAGGGALSLTSCGFEPIYGSHQGQNESVSDDLNAVAIDSLPDRPGQLLRNYLIDRMYGKGRPHKPLYHLIIALRSVQNDVGILANATSVLSELDSYADYKLTDAKGLVLVTGSAHSQSSYSQLNDQYATLAAHDSAVERTVREISEQITNRISLYFSNPPPPPDPTPIVK